MPRLVPQHLKSLNTINCQPQKVSSKTELIMLLDIAGHSNGDISKALDMSVGYVSTIKNSPIYKQELVKMREEMRKSVVDKKSDEIICGDPVEVMIKDACLSAAQIKISLMEGSESDFVKNAAASDVLGIGGYMKKTQKTTTVIEVDSKMASRWERVLADNPPRSMKITQIEDNTE